MHANPYSTEILRWASQLITPCRLADPMGTGTAQGRLCGSRFVVDIHASAGVVTGLGLEVSACRVGSAAAALLQARAEGTSITELRAVAACVDRMLMAGGEPPRARWRELEMFLPLRGDRFRSGTVLLPFQAMVRALDQIPAD